MRILFNSKDALYKSPFGVLREKESCSLLIKIPSECKTQKVFAVFENDHTKKEERFEFVFSKRENLYDDFSLTFSLKSTGLYFYCFYIITSDGEFPLFKEGDGTNMHHGGKWQVSVIKKDFTVPDVFKGRVMYQIFPDRFYREKVIESSEKLKPYTVHENTADTPRYRPDENGEVTNSDFFGGNFDGIIKKLDYLKGLNVSIIYLNPIFKAYSNHRYDTCDYKNADPMLGSEEDFARLCDEAHNRGMKIILDAVFSHTGADSIYFDKKGTFGTGAYSNENSPYKDWYSFGKSKDEYKSWWGFSTLPEVNEMSESYIDYIITGSDSVISHWLNLGADGFRLDVADELPDDFIHLLRQRVKEIKRESLIIGEVWEDASNKISYSKRRKYFTAPELDTVMNYVFKDAIIAFVKGEITSADFAERIETIMENYPKDALDSLMNSLSTHDTFRIISALSNAGNLTKDEMAVHTLSESEREEITKKLFLAVFLQFTLPGNACIYYGDEVGMEGFQDPFNRRYMRWEDEGNIYSKFYMSIAKLKENHPCLRLGDFKFTQKDDMLIFERQYKGRRVRGYVNISDSPLLCDAEKSLISHNSTRCSDELIVFKYGFNLEEI